MAQSPSSGSAAFQAAGAAPAGASPGAWAVSSVEGYLDAERQGPFRRFVMDELMQMADRLTREHMRLLYHHGGVCAGRSDDLLASDGSPGSRPRAVQVSVPEPFRPCQLQMPPPASASETPPPAPTLPQGGLLSQMSQQSMQDIPIADPIRSMTPKKRPRGRRSNAPNRKSLLGFLLGERAAPAGAGRKSLHNVSSCSSTSSLNSLKAHVTTPRSGGHEQAPELLAVDELREEEEEQKEALDHVPSLPGHDGRAGPEGNISVMPHAWSGAAKGAGHGTQGASRNSGHSGLGSIVSMGLAGLFRRSVGGGSAQVTPEHEPSADGSASLELGPLVETEDSGENVPFKLHREWFDWEVADQSEKPGTPGGQNMFHSSQDETVTKLMEGQGSFLHDGPEEGAARCSLTSLTVSPNSTKRLVWDMVASVLVGYECIVIPLTFFKIGDSKPMVSTGWFVRIFWTLDLPFSFITGYVLRGGNIEMRPWFVVKNYVKGWFVVDVSMIAADWAEVFVGGVGGLNAARMGKTVKSLRMLRMVRVFRLIRSAKMPDFLRAFVDMYIRSEISLIVLGIIKVFLFVVWVNHMSACIWYGLAQSAADDADGELNWVAHYGLESEPLVLSYLMAFHWSLTQFAGTMEVNPTNMSERIYAIVALLVAYMLSASIISNITSSMTRLSIATAQETRRFSALRAFLNENNISGKVALRVQKSAQYALQVQQRRISESSIELLSIISEPLRVELHYEMYSHVLRWHPFFDYLAVEGPAMLRQTCHKALSSISLAGGDVLFCEGEVSHQQRMYFITNGFLRYMRRQEMEEVEEGEWVCEAVLWTKWVHIGSMVAKTESTLLHVSAQELRNTAMQFQNALPYARFYGKLFIRHLRRFPEALTDLEDTSMDLSGMVQKYRETRGRVATRQVSKRMGSMSSITQSYSFMSSLLGRGGPKHTSPQSSVRPKTTDSSADPDTKLSVSSLSSEVAVQSPPPSGNGCTAASSGAHSGQT